jgi:cold shock protein
MRTFGTVKWFDPAEGMGCVVSEGGAQAALPLAALRAFGCETIEAGTTLTFEMKLTDAGLTVTAIYEAEVLADAEMIEQLKRLQPRRLLPDPPAPGPGDWQEVICKWFSRPKGYGFVQTLDGATDAFVHMDVLRKHGIRELRQGQRAIVRLTCGATGTVVSAIVPKAEVKG